MKNNNQIDLQIQELVKKAKSTSIESGYQVEPNTRPATKQEIENMNNRVDHVDTILKTVIIAMVITVCLAIGGIIIPLFVSYVSEVRQLQDSRYQLLQDKIQSLDEKYSHLLLIPSVIPTINTNLTK